MNILEKEMENTQCFSNTPLDPAATLNIQDLPDEVFLIIAEFLPVRDLDVCFNVCQRWRNIINIDKLWKKSCNYSEKYFKLQSVKVSENSDFVQSCKWRENFLIQKTILENWNSGRFVTDKLPVCLSNGFGMKDFVDNYGTHWLFCSGPSGIEVWNITSKPFSSFCHSHVPTDSDGYGILPLQDKILAYRSNYVQVFQFKYPDYSIKLNYRFKFERNEILPIREVVPDDDYQSGARYILVDNQYFIGYNTIITDIHSVFIHIWDLDSGRKSATQRVFQQSFVDFCKLKSHRRDVTGNFSGGLLLFDGDNGRFLVNLINDELELCQISVFSLVEMKFVKIVAQLESRTAWCFVKGDIAVIFHIVQNRSSQISVYNISISGGLLTSLDLPGIHNPNLRNEFLFEGSKVIVKTNDIINVLTIIDSVKVKKHDFTINEMCLVIKYYDPKFLILFERPVFSAGFTMSVWDVNSGVQLWGLYNNTCTLLNYQIIMFNKSDYPGRFFIPAENEEELKMLNFYHNL